MPEVTWNRTAHNPEVTWNRTAHNPEVAGSNPARATSEVAGQARFRRLLRVGSRQTFAQFLPKCRGNGLLGQLVVDHFNVNALLWHLLAFSGDTGDPATPPAGMISKAGSRLSDFGDGLQHRTTPFHGWLGPRTSDRLGTRERRRADSVGEADVTDREPRVPHAKRAVAEPEYAGGMHAQPIGTLP